MLVKFRACGTCVSKSTPRALQEDPKKGYAPGFVSPREVPWLFA